MRNIIKKTFVSLFVILFSSFSLFANELDVMSWNVKRLSTSTIKNKDTNILTSIINDDKYEIVCLQEILDKNVLKELTNKTVIISEKLGRKGYKEHIAFVLSDKFKDSDIKLFSYYDTHDAFEREPIMLLIDNEIAIVSLHLIYSREASKKITGDEREFTKREVRGLKNMFKYFSHKANIDESKIIVVGDFNLRKEILEEILNDKYVFIDEPTTLTQKVNKIGLNSFDHFIVSKENKLINISVKYDVIEKYLGNMSSKNRKYFKDNVSDHYPIEATIIYNQ